MTRTLIVDSNYHHPNKESFMAKFTDVVSEVSDETFYVGANSDSERKNLCVDNVERTPPDSISGKIHSLFHHQVYCIRKIRKTDPDVVLIRTPVFVFLVLYCRLFNINTGLFIAQKQGDLIQEYLTILSMHIGKNLLVESYGVLDQWGRRRFEYKSYECATYVDTDRYDCDEPRGAKDQLVVGYLGLLNKRKGVHILLRSIHRLHEEMAVDVSFEIAGDGNLANAVEATASEFSEVKYHGFLPDEEVPELYRRVDLIILPSTSEGVPNVVLESMACCTPVLATPVGGIADIIEDCHDGFILEHRDQEHLSKRLLGIAVDENLGRISEHSREKMLRNYCRNAAVKRYDSIISEIRRSQDQ